jgi:hypothetical protein
MSGPRESVFAAVTSALEAIQISSGYQVDVDVVYRVDILPDDMPSTVKNALLVLEGLSPETWEFLDSGASGGQLCRNNITIAGVVRMGTTDMKTSDRHTALNALIESAAKALMLDPTFGDACKESKLIGPIAFVDTDKGEGLFNMTLQVIYAFNWSDL